MYHYNMNISHFLENDIFFIRKAIALAAHARNQGEVPVGAVVVCNDQIIGEGWNQPIYRCDPTAHAEIMALRQAAKSLANYRLIHCTVYVTLEPCLMCLGALLHARIARLVFGATDVKLGATTKLTDLVDKSQINHRMEVTGGVLRELCATLLTDFFQDKRMQTSIQSTATASNAAD